MCKVCGGDGVVIMPARVITYAIDDKDFTIPAHLDLCKYCVEKHELEYQKTLLERSFDVTIMNEQ